MGEGIYLSVIIPAYNERERLGGTLDRIGNYLSPMDYEWEIIVVDDGSEDDTALITSRAAASDKRIRLVSNGANRGKGYSVRNGVAHARGEFILFSDADLSTPIEDIEKLFPYVLYEGFDIAIGSRALKDSDVRIHQPWYRELMGKIYNKIVRILVLRGLKDTQCGFKLFKADAAKEIFPLGRIDRFSFDVEVLYIARKKGRRIAEVPVTWYNSPRSRVSIVSDPFQMFLDIVRIRLNGLRGYYD